MHKPIVMYDVCDESLGKAPFPSVGCLYDTRAEALRELKKARQQYPRAYLAKIIHAPYRIRKAKTKAVKHA
jgi:hypothetical protein